MAMKLSVALCTYNGEKYIRQQIESILTQTKSVDEIVVCDDQSTDLTLKIISEIAKQSSVEFKIYNNEQRLNVVKNFEKAISKCTGELIFLCDQDDIWHIDKVEKIIEYFNGNPQINVIFSNARLIDEVNNLIEDKTLFQAVNFSTEAQKYFDAGYAFELLNHFNRVTGATVACKADYVKSLLPFNIYNRVIHDELIAISAINDECLGYINECLIDYRIHPSQKIGLGIWIKQPITNIFLDHFVVNEEYIDFLKFNPQLLQRVNFITKRGKNIKSPGGIFLFPFDLNKYKIIYGKFANDVISGDYKKYFELNCRRFKRLLKI